MNGPYDLDAGLRALAGSIEFPPTPDLAAAVRSRVSAMSPPARSRWAVWTSPPSRRVQLALAVAILAALGLATTMTVNPGVRDAVARFLHLSGASITRVSTLPPAPAVSGDLATRLSLGRLVSLDEARAAVSFRVRIPSALGTPAAIYLSSAPAGGEVTLFYGPRVDLPRSTVPEIGALISEFRGDLQPDFFGKLLGPDATVQDVQVDSVSGFWIAGASHEFFYGSDLLSLRLSGNALLWERDLVTLRIESGLSRDRAIAVANSLR